MFISSILENNQYFRVCFAKTVQTTLFEVLENSNIQLWVLRVLDTVVIVVCIRHVVTISFHLNFFSDQNSARIVPNKFIILYSARYYPLFFVTINLRILDEI